MRGSKPLIMQGYLLAGEYSVAEERERETAW